MKSQLDILAKIVYLEKRAESLYNVGTPLAQNMANEALSAVEVLKWVLEE